MPQPDEASLRFLFQEAKALLVAQLSAHERLDEKAGNVATFNFVILGLVVTGYADWSPSLLDQADHASFAAVVAGLIFLLASTIVAMFAYHPRDYATGLSAGSIESALGYDVTERAFLEEGIKAYHKAVGQNNRQLAKKAAFVRGAMWLLLPTMVLLLFGTIRLILTTVN